MNNNFHEQMMMVALEEARIAASCGEVPIGAVITKGEQIIARAHNLTENKKSPLAHAEVLVISQASLILNDKRLTSCTLYVTLEPCLMCSGAILLSRIKNLFYGSRDSKAGACRSLYETLDDKRLNHQCLVREGILEEKCSELLQEFFQKLRFENRNNNLR